MADNLNTPYLGQGTTSDNLNTRYIADSGSTEVEPNPRSYTSAVSYNGRVSYDGIVDYNSTVNLLGAVVLAPQTAGSANSSTVADGEIVIMESTNTNAILIFRSGNTTYHWPSSAGSVG